MRRFSRHWPILVGALSGAACAGLLSTVIPDRGGDVLKFPHERHAKGGLECIACHEPIYDATDLTERHLPPEAKCMECHRKEKEAGNCVKCHTDVGAIAPRAAPVPHLNFDHAKHIERVEEHCERCHVSLPEPGIPFTPPQMQQCFSCHEHQEQFDRGECAGCHKDLWEHPLRPVSFFTHDGGFLRGHPNAARSAGAACATCHDQTFCSDCHAKTTPIGKELKDIERADLLFVHRADFVSRHSTEAAANPASCASCHTASSCENCHTARGRAPGGPGQITKHPPGWAFPGSADFHGDAAKRNIGACAVCHDRGNTSDCVTCHKSGAIGGNPHPATFLARNPTVDRANGMCLECHR